MALMEKARITAQRARVQAAHGIEAGRGRIEEMRNRHLFERLGEAYYAEHCGRGSREDVTKAVEELDAHVRSHGEPGSAAVSTRKAREIMHAGVECVNEGESLATAAMKMRDLGVGSLPVCGADDRLHGIITDRDVVIRCIAEGRDPATVLARDLAQGNLFWVDGDADMSEVLRMMEEHQVKRLPVIENHRLVGMISEADLARALSDDMLAEFVERVYGRN